ncbi:hypothetical protein GCM10022280_27200 [Sphingomonas swuensis]|uniref:HTH marR-type domain-containing protein n=1 Tax=Sphingomonas swuensis TaxID=977800 RepID=A0ABP7TES1_9SPHN
MNRQLLRAVDDAAEALESREVPGELFAQVIDLLEAITARSREQAEQALLASSMTVAERRKLVLELARDERDKRQERQRHFARALFGEPAWELLLAIFISEGEGRSLALSKAAELIDHPLTTTIRWVEYLEASGLLIRERFGADRRVINIRPTTRAIAQIEAYFLGEKDDLDSEPAEPRLFGRGSSTARG